MMTRDEYNNSIHRFGIATGIILILIMIAAPCIICSIFGIWPDLFLIAPVFLAAFLIMCPNAVADALAYPPLIGCGSIYLAAITGNTYNQKMPCALMTQKLMNAEPGSEKGDVIAQVAVCIATLLTTVVLIVCVILGSTVLTPVLTSEVLSPAWNNVIPALLAGLLITLMWGRVKYFIAPIIVAVICNEFTTLSISYYMLICIVVSVACGMFFYKRKQKKQE